LETDVDSKRAEDYHKIDSLSHALGFIEWYVREPLNSAGQLIDRRKLLIANIGFYWSK